MLKQITLIFIFGTFTFLSAQNNTNTPYSLFGLGVENNAATAGLNGMANSGIGQKTYDKINIFNPANLANIQQQSFLQDYGVSGLYSTLKNYSTTESTTKGNVSHIVFAFPIKKGWGMSFGLLPYTTTGYTIDIESPIEGTADSYTTRIEGSGGLNKFYISSGLKITNRLSFGVDLTALFGTINQNRELFSTYLVNVDDENHYSGLKLKTGLQYDIIKNKNNHTTLGAIAEIPALLAGTQTRTSYKTSTSGLITYLETEEESDLDDFELPLTVGVGLSTAFRQFTTNLDYKKLFWEDTDQQENNTRYTNQSIYALGVEYRQINNQANFFRMVQYRFGLNYNSGFLKISNEQINSYFGTVGIGIPINKTGINRLNISYSYGTEGTTSSKLVKENFHRLSLNFSFNGNWFKKRKIL